jgi:hypothetical protein
MSCMDKIVPRLCYLLQFFRVAEHIIDLVQDIAFVGENAVFHVYKATCHQRCCFLCQEAGFAGRTSKCLLTTSCAIVPHVGLQTTCLSVGHRALHVAYEQLHLPIPPFVLAGQYRIVVGDDMAYAVAPRILRCVASGQEDWYALWSPVITEDLFINKIWPYEEMVRDRRKLFRS